MMKQPTKFSDFKAKPSGLAFALGLFVWALAGAPSLRAAEPPAPPPPPFINPDEAAGGTQSNNWALTGNPAPTPGAAGSDAAYVPSGTENSKVAAPEITDDQKIKNRMDDAYQLYRAEDYENAGKTAAQLVETYPKRQLYWVHYVYALCLEHQDLYGRAVEEYQKVIVQAPKSTYSNASSFRIGLCELKNGQEQEAIYTLREIIENNPRSEYRLQAYVHLGNLYRRSRDWRAAQRIYKDLIHLYPNTSWAYNSTMYLAETHAHQGHNDTAVRIYERLQADTSVPISLRAQAQLRIGDLYLTDQKWLEASNAYRLALRDYAKVPGVLTVAEEKMAIATEGRRSGRLPYRPVTGPRLRTEEPPDAGYQLKHQQESVPYQD
jgi:tetratricopeptide (TPR) repeat protein